MMFKIVLGLLVGCIALANASTAEEAYKGYKIYDVFAENEEQKELLFQLSNEEAFDFFVQPRILEEPARVMIAPEHQASFENLITSHEMSFRIVNHNVADSVRAEREEMEIAEREQMEDTLAVELQPRISFSSYQRYTQINAYMDDLAKAYPSRVKVKTLGKSYEGRDIKSITISNGDYVSNKKVILVDAGIHAREWIAPAGALYMIHQLVEKYSANSALLKNYDWVIVPLVNPDGYEYTFTKSRMWRKTRKPVSSSCYGTDGNRNYDFHWGEVGASSYACSDTFRGQTAFSEPETKIIRDLVLSLAGRAKMYLTLHSYGKYILYPWGYTSALPTTWRDMDAVAKTGAAAIKSNFGSTWTVGSSTNVLYAASGGSDDYAFAKGNIPISLTLELPAGGSGFDPSPAQIDPFVRETWAGTVAMAKEVIAKY